MTDAEKTKLEELVRSDKVVLFMKGNRRFPQCGFSSQVVQILDELLPSYTTVNVLQDPAVRDGIKVFSNWPTIPQLYVNGEFIGGCDIVREMAQTGELEQLLGVKREPKKAPTVKVTPAAAKAFRDAAESPSDLPRLGISPSFEYELFLDQKQPGDVEIDAGGLTLLLDQASASRADGVSIDFVTVGGTGFRIENPNEPPRVRPLSVQDLKGMMDRKEKIELFDVRTPEERKIAVIEGARHLDDAGGEYLQSLPKTTPVVMLCHHGVRSRAAAEKVLKMGFAKVYNLEGGIDAWSQHVDPKVARY